MLSKLCRYVVALFTLILSGNCFHAAADVIYTIQVVDSILGTTIPKAEALVFLPGDSVLVTEASPIYKKEGLQQRQILQFGLPERDTVYHVMVDAPGYDTPAYTPSPPNAPKTATIMSTSARLRCCARRNASMKSR